ncbi:S-layer homology domain-containing protein [Brevibacillus humidisoli]|uniref:YcdB/YcdC domain-containing protein n=1 Tax=Brevibacillus humidisoli TaxID=2895522 RepID=UPI001E44B3A0|nr:S-layer homology domain-containing protein [Brevibacillus humidisoli]UFJ41562.1 S-layer homology domain-containing protein [Brevibacillus humidisoli]
MKPVHLKRASCVLLSASLLLPLATAQAAPARAVEAQVNSLPTAAAVSGKIAAIQPSDVKLNKEKALAIAKSYVTLPAGAELTNTSFRNRDNWRSFPEWSFDWMKKEENGRGTNLSISVSINADTGELTSYHTWENKRDDSNSGQPIEREAAAKIAEQFLNQHASAKKSQVRLYDRHMPNEKPPLGNDVRYTFRYARVANDILFPDNGIYIEVDGSGKVTSYNLDWNDKITFPKPKETIGEDQAAEAFKESANAKPVYNLPWERYNDNQAKPYLVYQNPFEYFIDAQTGEPLKQDLEPRSADQEPVPVTNGSLTPHNSGGSLSQEDAVKLTNKLFSLSGYELASVNYYENESRSESSVWRLRYEKEGTSNEETSYVYVSLDAKTGDVLSFNNDMIRPLATESGKTEKVDWTEEQIREKAIAALKKYSPSIASELYLTDVNDRREFERGDWVSIHFHRLIDGIQAASGTASITFNLAKGEIEHYDVNIGSETYPNQPPSHASADEAVAAWWEEAKVELEYVLPPIREELIKMGKANPEDELTARLVYRVSTTPYEQPYAYHAETGEWVSLSTGNTISLHRVKPSDIEGHPAEKQLTLMYEYDAISPIDGKLMPERAITRGEMIKMLMITLNHGRFYPERYALDKATFNDVTAGSQYFAYVEAAVQSGLLSKDAPNLKPDETITRGELADMLVRALGLHKLADYDSLFATNVTDISEEERGTIAIITTLGIMSAQDGKFSPDLVVNRADAAVAFSRFLEKRNELNLGQAPSYMY